VDVLRIDRDIGKRVNAGLIDVDLARHTDLLADHGFVIGVR
jgi:hypothetical protein